MTGELAGQVAIVTGGGQGIGCAIAQELARAGAAVAVTARNLDRLEEAVASITAAGGQAIALPADVTDSDAIEKVLRDTERQLGPVDLLVNNAGVFSGIGPMWEVDLDAWWRNMEVNVRGLLICARAVLPGMISRKRGRIVNVSSVSVNGGLPHMTGYSVSKAAALRLTEKLAQEVQEHNVQVFALDPGLVYTAMSNHIIESSEGQRWLPMSREMWRANAIPAEPVGEAVAFLATGQADGLSGRYLRVADDLKDLTDRTEDINSNDLRSLRLRM
jgi:NAD(P)-dependent dehydrogenase (short-subunit alcohol dehydrogenase family)